MFFLAKNKKFRIKGEYVGDIKEVNIEEFDTFDPYVSAAQEAMKEQSEVVSCNDMFKLLIMELKQTTKQ